MKELKPKSHAACVKLIFDQTNYEIVLLNKRKKIVPQSMKV